MTISDLIISCMPPFLAIILQKFHIPTNRSMAAAGVQEKRRTGLDIDKIVEHNLRGAVAQSSLAVNIIGFMTGAFALIHFLPNSLEWVCLLVVFLIVIVLWVWTKVGDYSLYTLSVMRYRVSFYKEKGIFRDFGPISLIDWVAYTLNSLLILLSCVLFSLEDQPQAPRKHDCSTANSDVPHVPASFSSLPLAAPPLLRSGNPRLNAEPLSKETLSTCDIAAFQPTYERVWTCHTK